jgi:uncharacterized protein YkwD
MIPRSTRIQTASRYRSAIPLFCLLMSCCLLASRGIQASSYDRVHALERRVVELTNEVRARHGLRPLRPDAVLWRAARAHSDEMLRLNYFSHYSPDPGQRTVSERAAAAGCPDLEVGENLAFYEGYNLENAAQRVVNDWMASPGHRANLLRPGYTSIAVALVSDGRRIYATQVFAARHLALEPPGCSNDGHNVLVRFSGRSLESAQELAVFDGNTPLVRCPLGCDGGFSTAVRLPANSGRHSLRLGLLTTLGTRQSMFDLYDTFDIDTNGVAAR